MRSTLTTAQYEEAHDTQSNRSRNKRAEIPRTPMPRSSVSSSEVPDPVSSVSSSEVPDPAEMSQAHPALAHMVGVVIAPQPVTPSVVGGAVVVGAAGGSVG